jgi:serine/threonine-protein kinase
VVVSAALLAGAIVGGAYWYAYVRVPTYDMPVLVGLTDDKVPELIADRLWIPEREDIYLDGTKKGQILEQRPAAYEQVPRGATIWIKVSRGPTPVPVPTDLRGKSISDATSALAAVGLRTREHERRFDENAAMGEVISVAPGTPVEVPKGDEVGLIVSAGPAPRTIAPELIGHPVDEVLAQLNVMGLKPNRVDVYEEGQPAGAVIRIDPAPGTQVPKGTTVTVTVSKGQLIVPHVEGMSGIDAARQLQAMGFTPDLQGIPFFPVTSVSPPPDTPVRPGTRVVITTSIG